jgi:hypothetical protein
LSTGDKVSLPENIRVFTPVSGGGGLIRFNYATCDDIRACDLEHVFIAKGVVSVKTITRGDSAHSGATVEALPGLENYSRVTFLVEPKDSMTILKRGGDSLRENEIIARKTPARFFREQVALLEEKRGTVNDLAYAAASDLEERIAAAEQAMRIDSQEYSHAGELLRNGFVSQDLLTMSQLKWFRNRRILSGLVASKGAAAAKTALEIETIDLAIREIEAKSARSERESVLRSPVNGILFDIRRIPRNEKTELMVIIRRFR